MATYPSASPCPPTDVRWKSLSPDVQRPRMYHFPQCPSSSLGCTSDCTQVPAGVVAFHDDTSVSRPNDSGASGGVHDPETYVPDPSTPSPLTSAYGSAYGVLTSPFDARVNAPFA